jgi:3-oxoacyl-[acyl-carrier protein] reductase
VTVASESTPAQGERVRKAALISGGAKGIGRELGLRLGEQGWAVALCYRKSRAEAEATALAIEDKGGRALPIHADVSTPEVCAALVRQVLDWQGRIDAFIHCAGPYHRVDVLDETPAGWREMFAGNLDSFFYLARLVAPVMVKQQAGRIVAFSMANADRLMAQTQLTAHYLAKVGVLGLVRSLAKALAKDKITVNAVSPGFVDSGSVDEAELAGLIKTIPAGRIGSVADAVNAVLYLLSDEASYVTGTSLHVSGGWGI